MSGYATTLPRAAAGELRRSRRRALRRDVAVTLGLGGISFVLFVLTLSVGSAGLSPWEVVGSLTGLAENPAADFIVHELRLPVAVAALCVGLALGISGTIFQQLFRNPLATPEFIGISEGASLAAVAGIVLFSLTGYGVPGAALGGAIGGAALIYLLAWRGGVDGYRLILIGIGISEFMLACVTYLVAHADIRDAREAMHWLVGSIGQTGGDEQRVLIVALAILGPLALLLARGLRALDLGDDAARALGARVEAVRFGLIAVAVALVAFATAVAGPIAFVALVAGPIAQRLVGPSGAGIIAAGLVGASVVLAADLVSQHVLPVALPTGVVTGAVGAPYLLAVLVGMNRQGRGA